MNGVPSGTAEGEQRSNGDAHASCSGSPGAAGEPGDPAAQAAGMQHQSRHGASEDRASGTGQGCVEPGLAAAGAGGELGGLQGRLCAAAAEAGGDAPELLRRAWLLGPKQVWEARWLHRTHLQPHPAAVCTWYLTLPCVHAFTVYPAAACVPFHGPYIVFRRHWSSWEACPSFGTDASWCKNDSPYCAQVGPNLLLSSTPASAQALWGAPAASLVVLGKRAAGGLPGLPNDAEDASASYLPLASASPAAPDQAAGARAVDVPIGDCAAGRALGFADDVPKGEGDAAQLRHAASGSSSVGGEGPGELRGSGRLSEAEGAGGGRGEASGAGAGAGWEGTPGHMRHGVESGFVAGFQLACEAGPLCDEPLWGVAFNVRGSEFLTTAHMIYLHMLIYWLF